MEPLLERIHGATRHVGKVPAALRDAVAASAVAATAAPGPTAPGDARLRDLRADLEHAVASEEYERAAALRDAIRKLEDDGGSG